MFESTADIAPVKLIDFGIAVSLSGGGLVTGGLRFGTSSYWAPEQVAQQPYDFAVDMWSVGILMCILLAGDCHELNHTFISELTH